MAAVLVLHHLAGRSGPPFFYQGQGHGMTLNIKHHLSNYHFSALELQSKLKLNLHVHAPLKFIHQTYEYIRGFYAF